MVAVGLAVPFLSPTRLAMLKAEARDDSTGRGVLDAGAAGAVAPGVGDLGDGLGPPMLQVGVGLGVAVNLDETGDSDGEGVRVKSISAFLLCISGNRISLVLLMSKQFYC